MVSLIFHNLKESEFIGSEKPLKFIFDQNSEIFSPERINVFMGKNNSGKSKFLRTIFNDENISTYGNKEARQKADILRNLKDIRAKINVFNHGISLKRYVTIVQHTLESYTHRKFNAVLVKELYLYLRKLEADDEIKNLPVNSQGLINKEIYFKSIESLLRIIKNHGDSPGLLAEKSIYIPVLRGLRPLKKGITNENYYQDRTINDYFNNSIDKSEIYTGLEIFEQIRSKLLGDHQDRNMVADFEVFLGSKIFNKKVTLIPRDKEDTLEISFDDNKQRPIYEVGDGIQSVISILYPLFINSHKKCIVYIEEPETHLHPEWQSLILDSLKFFDKNQYFITSHSAVFINDPDVMVYKASYSENTISITTAKNNNEKIKVLKELGYTPSQILQTNFVLWVEGKTDVPYLEDWISKIDGGLVLNKHYCIFSLGGSNYEHLVFNDDGEVNTELFELVAQNFGMILDSDRKDEDSDYDSKKLRLKKYFEEKGHYFWLTNKREIENYIPFDIYKNTVEQIQPRVKGYIKDGDYFDRTKINIELESPIINNTLSLDTSLIGKFQDNIDSKEIDITKGVSESSLRKSINEIVKIKKEQKIGIDKNKLANELREIDYAINDEEQIAELKKLTKFIRGANNLV